MDRFLEPTPPANAFVDRVYVIRTLPGGQIAIGEAPVPADAGAPAPTDR